MNTGLKEVAQMMDTINKDVSAHMETHTERVKALADRLDDFEAKSQRIIQTSHKTDNPELGRYLKMGNSPTETKDLSVTQDGQGVSVRGDWNNQIFEKVIESSPIRMIAGQLTTDSNEIEVLVDRQEPASDWIGELDTRTATNTSFMTRHAIPVHEHYALPAVTLQMLEDSQFRVEAWLQSKLSDRFSRQEANAFVNGDGDGKPRGILDYDIVPEDSFSWGSDPDTYEIGAHYSGVAGDIDDADILIDLVDSLKAAYLPTASWMMTRAFRNKLRKLKDTQERYLYIPSLDSATPDRLLGYPVYLAEDMPAPATDVVGALFGDFSRGYTIVDRTGMTIQRDAVTTPGWVKYYCRRRIGGSVTNPEAIKALVLGDATT